MAELPPPPVEPPPAHHAEVAHPRAAQAVVRHAIEACGAVSVEVRWLGLGAELPEAARFHVSGDPCAPNPRLALDVLVDGARVQSFAIRPSLHIVVPAPVAPRALAVGEAFEPVDGTAPIEELRGLGPLPGRLIASRPLAQGDPVTARVAYRAPDVTAGTRLELEVTRGAVRVSVPAVLLADGFVGQTVQARNDVTGAVQRGVLVGPGRVRLP